MTPAWVRHGVRCVCTDDDWKDIFETGTSGSFPVRGSRYTISTYVDIGGVCYLVLSDPHVSPDLYSASAFRPLTPLESDVALFDFAFIGAAASAERERESSS